MMLGYYKLFTKACLPFASLWLRYRAARGKEELGRLDERYGKTHYARGKGKLLWVHAASVGEANSVFALIQLLRARFPQLHILLTTGTVTSAQLMKQRLPAGVIHQYVPLDIPKFTERFVRHWHPDVAWFVESELWPNLIASAKEYSCLMAIVNGRMSARSFDRWLKFPREAKKLFASFAVCFAGSEEDARRFEALGATNISCVGNLKYDAPNLPCDEAALLALKEATDKRIGWLAASTHSGEEMMVAQSHAALVKKHPNLLTIIVPRHAHRGDEVAAMLAKTGRVAQRSKGEQITAETAFYVADTMGELGLFYRLCDVVFMGGSLISHGGQNPLEPARLACAILAGPHVHNFSDIYHEMVRVGAVKQVENAATLTKTLEELLGNYSVLDAQQTKAKSWVEQKGGASEKILHVFEKVFAP